MGKHIGDECVERFGVAFGFNLHGVGAHVAHEAADIVARRDSADGFTKENTLNYTSHLYLSSLAHIGVNKRNLTAKAPKEQRPAIRLTYTLWPS